MSVITRFAPSPTGYLHIGGARTALFNALYAKRHGGKMLLRIEDTDRVRSTEPAIHAIIEGLQWLGVEWEGEPIYQFARASRHAEVVAGLLAAGKAYKCYCSPDELAKMREDAAAAKLPPRYNGLWRDRDEADAPAGVAPVIRLKAPQTGKTMVADQVQGHVEFDNKDLDDLILLRSDGTPTYMLAVVVDDHDMGVTHIIRGNDHFTNAARQIQIYNACGWNVPVMSHIPLIHGADGAKLSKRHGALGVEAYREMGYLPAALRNYLVRLGWSHGDQEFFTDEEMSLLFALENVGRSPSRFDFAKLENMNGQYIRNSENEALMANVMAFLPFHPTVKSLSSQVQVQMLTIMNGLKDRAKTLVELIDSAHFLYGSKPFAFEDKARALLTLDAKILLQEVASRFSKLEEWSAVSTDGVVRALAEENHVKLGAIAQPLRAAMTGKTTSPGIFDVLAVLGKEETLIRINDAIA